MPGHTRSFIVGRRPPHFVCVTRTQVDKGRFYQYFNVCSGDISTKVEIASATSGKKVSKTSICYESFRPKLHRNDNAEAASVTDFVLVVFM